MLALADGEIRLRGEQGANKGAVSPGKTWACWRDRMKKQGFAGSKAPTRAPSAGEKAARVGVGGRRNKASRGARRQQGRRQPGKNLGPVGVGGRRNKASRGARHQHRRRQLGKNRTLLALADGETKLPEERGANMSGPVGSLMRAAFGKSEEMTTGRPEVSGCRQFFVVPNANWNRRHEEMIRIDGERGRRRVCRQFFLFYIHTS